MANAVNREIRYCIFNEIKDEWMKQNPVLLDGELGLERDTKRLKIGDGISRYSELEYAQMEPRVRPFIGRARYQDLENTEELEVWFKCYPKNILKCSDSDDLAGLNASNLIEEDTLIIAGANYAYKAKEGLADICYVKGVELYDLEGNLIKVVDNA